jgi:hypothetical protein
MSYIVATYSEGTGNIYSESKTLITDILSLLPDNVTKEITPRDVRDAILSTWESSVIRYNSNGTDPYIGVYRDDVKDIKLYLGKREMSGQEILTATLSSLDSDILFYNFKSDSAGNQDLKISFLSGTSSTLHNSAPYLKSAYVSSPESLSLSIINPATFGTVTLESGASVSISINNLTWPSKNYINNVISSPSSASASSATDLFLAVRSGGNIELLTYASSGGTLGSGGSTTTILGSPVLINGQNFNYSNATPTVATFGGIPLGTTFSSVSIIDLVESMLYPELPPSGSIELVSVDYGLGGGFVPLSFNNTIERKQTGSPAITFKYNVSLTKKTYNIDSVGFRCIRDTTTLIPTSGSFPTLTLSGSGLQSSSFASPYSFGVLGTTIAAGNDISIFTFSVNAKDAVSNPTFSFTASTVFQVVFPYFYGFGSTSSTANIQSVQLTTDWGSGKIQKRIDIKTDQTLSLAGTGYIHFMYPNGYGTLSTILDGNNFVEYTHNSVSNWTYSVVAITHPTSTSYFSTKSYYVYRKTVSTTIPPSQNYKFNF